MKLIGVFVLTLAVAQAAMAKDAAITCGLSHKADLESLFRVTAQSSFSTASANQIVSVYAKAGITISASDVQFVSFTDMFNYQVQQSVTTLGRTTHFTTVVYLTPSFLIIDGSDNGVYDPIGNVVTAPTLLSCTIKPSMGPSIDANLINSDTNKSIGSFDVEAPVANQDFPY